VTPLPRLDGGTSPRPTSAARRDASLAAGRRPAPGAGRAWSRASAPATSTPRTAREASGASRTDRAGGVPAASRVDAGSRNGAAAAALSSVRTLASGARPPAFAARKGAR
jgi:hypothetical protein